MLGWRRFLWVAVLVCAGPLLGAAPAKPAPFFAQLRARMAGSAYVKANPALNRFAWLRQYFPTTTLGQRRGFLTRLYHSFLTADKQRAVAVYLYQMYISSATYGGEMPRRLNINYLGALDALERLQDRFDVRGAEAFYQKNKAEIKALLQQFFAQSRLAVYAPQDPRNDAAEIAFLRALAASTYGGERAAYALETPRGTARLDPADLAWLQQIQHASNREIAQKVALYEVDGVDLAMMDPSYSGPLTKETQYLYRPAAKECAACSYLTCRQVCRQPRGRAVRLYQLQLRAKNGGLLEPARGTYFRNPKGGFYPGWSYHEAVLIVLNRQGHFTPVVLDRFLSDKPLLWQEWLALFKKDNTLLYAYPFQRWDDTEARLVRPQHRQGDKVYQQGRAYEPFPAEY